MDKITDRIKNMKAGDTETDFGDNTTYVVKSGDSTYAVCDNGEEITCRSAEEAARIVKENVKSNR